MISKPILVGNNTFVWNGIDGLEINPTNIPISITSITGQGVAATRLPNDVWVGSLTSLVSGQEYNFQLFFVFAPTPATSLQLISKQLHITITAPEISGKVIISVNKIYAVRPANGTWRYLREATTTAST